MVVVDEDENRDRKTNKSKDDDDNDDVDDDDSAVAPELPAENPAASSNSNNKNDGREPPPIPKRKPKPKPKPKPNLNLKPNQESIPQPEAERVSEENGDDQYISHNAKNAATASDDNNETKEHVSGDGFLDSPSLLVAPSLSPVVEVSTGPPAPATSPMLSPEDPVMVAASSCENNNETKQITE